MTKTEREIDLDYAEYCLGLKEDLISRLVEKHGLLPNHAQWVAKNLEGLRFNKPVARLCVDLSEPTCLKAMGLLTSVGFEVSATPCSGLIEPNLMLGNREYFGYRKIEELVDEVLGRFIQGVPEEELLTGC